MSGQVSLFFFSSRRRHTILVSDWSSDVCSSDLNCIAHGRRKFVEVAENFPEECRYVLKQLGKVYKNDAFAREQGMSPEERLRFHQVESGPRMKERSEERRVGKECISRGARGEYK